MSFSIKAELSAIDQELHELHKYVTSHDCVLSSQDINAINKIESRITAIKYSCKPFITPPK